LPYAIDTIAQSHILLTLCSAILRSSSSFRLLSTHAAAESSSSESAPRVFTLLKINAHQIHLCQLHIDINEIYVFTSVKMQCYIYAVLYIRIAFHMSYKSLKQCMQHANQFWLWIFTFHYSLKAIHNYCKI